MRGLGLQWMMASTIVSVLWCISLPVMYYYSVVKEGGLVLIWKMMPFAYIVLDAAMMLCFLLKIERQLVEK